MSCNNTISFENLVKTPIGLGYSDNNKYSATINTDNLHLQVVPVESSAQASVCGTGSSIVGKAMMSEIRVSGYLIYSISVDALNISDSKFSIDPNLNNVSKAGWLSDASILPISSYNSTKVEVPYIVVKYQSLSAPQPTDDNIMVTLTKLDTKYTVDEKGITLILLEGEFVITVS